MRRLWQRSHRSSRAGHQCHGFGLVTLNSASNIENALQGPWGLSGLPLIFWLDVILGIMALLGAVIVCDLESIPLVRTVLTSPHWGFLLGFSGLGSIGLKGVSLGGVELGGIFLTRGEASLSVSSPSSTHLFHFSPSFPRSF